MQYCKMFIELVLEHTVCFFEVDFLDTCFTTSAENNVSELRNLKIFWGRIPQYTPGSPTGMVPSAREIMSPRCKKPSYGPDEWPQ